MKMCLLLGEAVKMHQTHNKLCGADAWGGTYNAVGVVMSHLQGSLPRDLLESPPHPAAQPL